jgi:Secretion system C-terminal sorting domain
MRKFTSSALIAMLSILSATIASAQGDLHRITVTISGNGTPGFVGDGNPGISDEANYPYDVCRDAANNIYYTDLGNGRVRKIWAKNGMITTIAGGGTATTDGPATAVSVVPRNISIDRAGNIYFVDSASNTVKKVDMATGMLTTVAGNGTRGYAGDGGPATAAEFNTIQGICVDNSNNLYLVDAGNFRIREVTAAGNVQTIAGTGVSGYTGDGGPATAATINTPTAICVDRTKDIFFADQASGYQTRIRKISAATHNISTYIGSSSSVSSTLYDDSALTTWLGNVTGIALDDTSYLDSFVIEDSSIYDTTVILDTLIYGSDTVVINDTVITDSIIHIYINEISCSCREMNSATDSVYPVAGNFDIESYADNKNSNLAYMNNPYGICMGSGASLYIADAYNHRIRKLIQLSNVPRFAYGEGQLVNLCRDLPTSINAQMSITDIDSGETETWTVVTAPTHGTLIGFPYTMTSYGADSLTTPSGVDYFPASGFSGNDSFQVKVSDGTHSDIVTMYVVVGAPTGIISSTTGGSFVPTGSSVMFSESVPGGVWSVTNGNAAISNTGVVTGLTAGTDTIIYTLTNSCGTRVATKVIEIKDATTGVTAVTHNEGWDIYPNPTTSTLNVKWADRVSANNITITDVAGKELMSQPAGANATGSVEINVSSLAPGVYFVKFSNTEVRKFVKE